MISGACSDEVIVNMGQPVLDVRNLDFGEVVLGEQKEQQLSLFNVGSGPLVIESFTLVQDDSSFQFEGSPKRIEAFSEVSIQVFFEPKRERALSAVIVLKSNAANQARKEIILNGLGAKVGSSADAGSMSNNNPDATTPMPDASVVMDGGQMTQDAAEVLDVGFTMDATAPPDTGPADTGVYLDAMSTPIDTGVAMNADAGLASDGGGEQGPSQSATCTGGYMMTSYSRASGGNVELNIVGVYEPSPGGQGQIVVNIQRTEPMILVLSSYEPVNWLVQAIGSAQIQEVILNGYNAHTVSGLVPGTPVTNRTGGPNYLSACAYVWPSSTGGCDTPGLVSGAEALTQLQLTSFISCYQANAFTIGP